MTEHERPIPHYFVRDGEAFVPSGLARNPWFANAVAGGPIAALIGQLIEEARFDAGLEICRLTLDILGVVPHAPLTARFVPGRACRQAQFPPIETTAERRGRKASVSTC